MLNSCFYCDRIYFARELNHAGNLEKLKLPLSLKTVQFILGMKKTVLDISSMGNLFS